VVERVRRSAAVPQQQTLLGLNLTVIAALTGVVIANKASPELLLVVPVVSSAFGLLWLDHHIVISRLGAATRELLSAMNGYRTLPHRPEPPGWRAIYWSCMGLNFAGVGVGALAVAWPGEQGSAEAWLVCGVGAVLATLFLVAFVHQAWAAFGSAKDLDRVGEGQKH
jgi:hypothetical protein